MATAESKSIALDERQPTDSERSVVFRGDGEPKTPQSMLRALVEIDSASGIEADNYSIGGTVGELESRFADMLGKEAAIFMPTGTLANHLAIRQLCGVRPRAIVQEQSHLYNDTGDCVTRLSSINLIPLAKGKPCFTYDEVREIVTQSETGRVANDIGAMMIESPVRRGQGQIMPFDEMKAVTKYCNERGIGTHLDGARLYMMSAATKITPTAYAALFDTVYVSLYKYFGASFGAILAGDSSVIDGLYHERRMFGSGLSTASFAAALALAGTEGFEERFAKAMDAAASLFNRLKSLDGLRVEKFEHGSNIFPMCLEPEVDVKTFVGALKERWVFAQRDEDDSDKVFLTVNTTILRQSEDELVEAFSYALAQSLQFAH